MEVISHWLRNAKKSVRKIIKGIFLTESGIEHVKRHLVALLGTSNSDQALVAVISRLIDLDDATAEGTNLVDLSAPFANNGTDHVIGNIYLLC